MTRSVSRRMSGIAALAMTAATITTGAMADENADLVINGDIPITVRAPAPDHLENVDEIMSGWVFRSAETQALGMDDFENPGMIDADTGVEAFSTAMGGEGKSCASCHEGGVDDVAQARATYPKWDEERGMVQTIEMQINECVTERMGGEALDYTGGAMTSFVAAISAEARGTPVNVAIDGPAQSTWEKGKEIYYTRYGQLELACSNCHEDNYGNMIRADHLSQGQINGFPTYRLNNAKLNTVHDRFRGCIRDTRAETFAVGSDEFVALELYVASRGNGLSVEGPSVRN